MKTEKKKNYIRVVVKIRVGSIGWAIVVFGGMGYLHF